MSEMNSTMSTDSTAESAPAPLSAHGSAAARSHLVSWPVLALLRSGSGAQALVRRAGSLRAPGQARVL